MKQVGNTGGMCKLENAKRIFAIGDIHGCFDELRDLVEKLPLDENSVLVFLGDYIDRGPNTRGVIDYILQFDLIWTTNLF